MIGNKQLPQLNMAQKLKMLRELNDLSQEQLGQKLNVSYKTISAWENGERDINLTNAQAICKLFNIPDAYFVFNENFEKVDYDLKERILEYIENKTFKEKIETIISCCKQKIEKDGLPFKKEYLPSYDYENKEFISYGLFAKESLPYNKGTVNEAKLEQLDSYSYSSAELTRFGLYDILERLNGDKVELIDLIDCNSLDIFKATLSKMEMVLSDPKSLESPNETKYTVLYGYSVLYGYDPVQSIRHKITAEYVIQQQLNKVLEELNPNLSKYWDIVMFLIDNGAYYVKQIGHGDDITVFDIVKDTSKTNMAYALAKKMILK